MGVPVSSSCPKILTSPKYCMRKGASTPTMKYSPGFHLYASSTPSFYLGVTRGLQLVSSNRGELQPCSAPQLNISRSKHGLFAFIQRKIQAEISSQRTNCDGRLLYNLWSYSRSSHTLSDISRIFSSPVICGPIHVLDRRTPYYVVSWVTMVKATIDPQACHVVSPITACSPMLCVSLRK